VGYGLYIVIDDDETVRYSLRAVLEDAGHTVLEAENGQQAMDVLAGGDVDVAVVDIIMPIQEGVETTIQIGRWFPDVKTSAMSGGGRSRNLDFLQVARNFGACDALEKPFSGETLLASVEACLGPPCGPAPH